MSLKCAQSDDAKTEYANQLQKSNKLQLSHYQTSLPTVRIAKATTYKYQLN